MSHSHLRLFRGDDGTWRRVAPASGDLVDLIQAGLGFSVRRRSRAGVYHCSALEDLARSAKSGPVRVVKRREDTTVDEYLVPNEAEDRLDRERAVKCDYCGEPAAGVYDDGQMCRNCFDRSWQAAVAKAVGLVAASRALVWTAAGLATAAALQRDLDAAGRPAVEAAVDALGPLWFGEGDLVGRCARRMRDEHPRVAKRLAAQSATNLYRGTGRT